MTKTGIVDRILVGLFSVSIAWVIIFGAYYRKGIKTALLLSFVLLAIIGFREKKFKISSFLKQYLSPIYTPFIFFGLSAFVATVFSKDFRQSQHIFIERYIFYFIIFEMGRRFFVSQTVSRILADCFKINIFEFMKYILIFAGLLLGIGGVVDHIRFHPERLFSGFGYEHMFPRYILYFLPVVYCFMFKGNTLRQRFFAILTFALLCMCMIFNGARAAWIAGPCSLFFATSLIDKKHLKYFIPGFLIYFYFIYFFMPMRISNFDTYFYRKDLLQAAIDIFRDNIFFGAGPGMYEKLVYTYSKGYVTLHAHNTYLEVLAELGIIGLTAFLTIFISFYFRVFKKLSMLIGSPNRFLCAGLLASNFAYLILAFFSSVITVGFNAPIFWLIFGMIFGLTNIQFGAGSIKPERTIDGGDVRQSC